MTPKFAKPRLNLYFSVLTYRDPFHRARAKSMNDVDKVITDSHCLSTCTPYYAGPGPIGSPL